MSALRVIASWTEGLVRIAIGVGLSWIGLAEGSGYGELLVLVGAVCVVAGAAEIWFVGLSRWSPHMIAVPPNLTGSQTGPEVVVFYATTEGQTQRISERIATMLTGKGIRARAVPIDGVEAGNIEWPLVRGAIVGASLHARRHQRVAERFVRAHAADLNRHPSAFFSVSLSAASTHLTEREAARRIAEEFPATLGWHPAIVRSIAGRLAYTRYGLLTRLLMKRIARQEGAPTDATRDFELTCWADVESFAGEVARAVGQSNVGAAA